MKHSYTPSTFYNVNNQFIDWKKLWFHSVETTQKNMNTTQTNQILYLQLKKKKKKSETHLAQQNQCKQLILTDSKNICT